jgi:phosphate transport system substrate-binding protein
VAVASAGVVFAAEGGIEGAGATFPAPLYARWASQYLQETGRVVRYGATGSGAGIERIERGLVDFGGTDAPLTREERERHAIVQFPVVMGGIVPVFNITGIRSGQLRLTGAVLADIYLGRVVRWNDPAIVNLNPDLDLPSSNITVVHRADASGTTFLWSEYLARSSADWRTRVGTGTSLQWPVGVADIGNEGVASSVQRTRMSIGYVEYAYAAAHRLAHVSLRNREGVFVEPGRTAFEAAAGAAAWKQRSDLDQLLIDQPGAGSWPIVGASFILLQASTSEPARTLDVLRFFDWAMRHGASAAAQLDYVVMPEAAVDLMHQVWSEQPCDAQGRPVWPASAASR